VKYCQQQLDTAEKRIEIITRNAKGEPRLEPFDAEASAPPNDAKAATKAGSSTKVATKAKADDGVSLF
jgi:hypothetical protein